MATRARVLLLAALAAVSFAIGIFTSSDVNAQTSCQKCRDVDGDKEGDCVDDNSRGSYWDCTYRTICIPTIEGPYCFRGCNLAYECGGSCSMCDVMCCGPGY